MIFLYCTFLMISFAENVSMLQLLDNALVLPGSINDHLNAQFGI